jgi:hypothetical protein
LPTEACRGVRLCCTAALLHCCTVALLRCCIGPSAALSPQGKNRLHQEPGRLIFRGFLFALIHPLPPCKSQKSPQDEPVLRKPALRFRFAAGLETKTYIIPPRSRHAPLPPVPNPSPAASQHWVPASSNQLLGTTAPSVRFIGADSATTRK